MPSDAEAGRIAARRRAYKNISLGITLICVGIVLLLNTLGRVSWGIWFDLFRLWPLLLITIGLRSIFVPTRLHPLSLLGPLLVAVSMGVTVARHQERAISGFDQLDRGQAVGLSCPGPLRSAAARVHLAFALGSMRVAAQPDAPRGGIAGTLRYAGKEPPWACSNEGDLWLGAEGPGGGLHIMVPFVTRRTLWEALLASPHPVAVRGDLLAAAADLDLRSFDLDHIDLDLVATRAVLRLGSPRRRVAVRLEGAAATVRIVIPPGTCFTIARDRVLNVLRGPSVREAVRRGRRAIGADCPGGDPPHDMPRYDINYELPVSTVEVETESGV